MVVEGGEVGSSEDGAVEGDEGRFRMVAQLEMTGNLPRSDSFCFVAGLGLGRLEDSWCEA